MAREAGRDRMPISWVAIDAGGNALGRVGLDEFDPEERRDRSPWVQGVIVQPEHRGVGIGGRLMAHLEGWARSRGYDQAWVATGGRAIDFYRKCGWTITETFIRNSGEVTTILTKRL